MSKYIIKIGVLNFIDFLNVIFKMRSEGFSYSEIGNSFKMSEGLVNYYIKNYSDYIFRYNSLGTLVQYKNILVREDGCFFSVSRLKQIKVYCNKKASGYGYVYVSPNKSERAHRVVAKCFIPNPLDKPSVNHKDGNKLNNCVNNLEWVTLSENQLHSYLTNKKRIKHRFKMGRDILISILNDRISGISIKDISLKYKLAPTTISSIIHRGRNGLDVPKELFEKAKQVGIKNAKRSTFQKACVVTASEDSDDCGVYHSASIYPGNPGSFSFN